MRETDSEKRKIELSEKQPENKEVIKTTGGNVEDAEQTMEKETNETENDVNFEEVLPSRQKRKMNLINAILSGAIIVCIIYVLVTITGEYNSFSDKEIMDIRTAVMHERIYGKMADSDWKKISKMKVEKTTLDDGYVVIENSRRGTLLFGYGTQEPSVYRPGILKRFLVNLPLFFIMLVVIELIILIVYAIIDHYNNLEEDDYYDYYDD